MRKEFTVIEKASVRQFLLEGSSGGKLAAGRWKEAVVQFNSSRRSISRIWAEAQKQRNSGQPIVLHYGKHNKRAKRVIMDIEFIKSIGLNKRSSWRGLAEQVGCSSGTVGKWVWEGLIRSHTSTLKRELTAPNKLSRVRFALEAIKLDTSTNMLRFKSMHNVVLIDEKWFYLTKVTRPIFGQDSSVLFDGKIGIFPFIYQEPAKRSSKNRATGTMITKAIDSITKEVLRGCLLEKVIPAIKAKWPTVNGTHVMIQQDNAKPHIKDDDPLFREASLDGGLSFSLVQQPPNSPDTNVNDLGFFQCIQSLQHQTSCNTIDDLVKAVEKFFQDLTATKLNNIFLTLQGCLLEILKVKGETRYKVPHLGKEHLIREGTLPLNLEVPTALAQDSLIHLLEAGWEDEIEKMWEDFGFAKANG